MDWTNLPHEYHPKVHHRQVKLVGALRSIAQREHETGHQRDDVEPCEDDAEDVAGGAEEFFVGKGFGEDLEDEEEVALM